MSAAGGKGLPGLNEKAGRAGSAGDLDTGFSMSAPREKLGSCGSIAECGRLPVARVYEEGAEEVGLAGKTKGGLGSGMDARGVLLVMSEAVAE